VGTPRTQFDQNLRPTGDLSIPGFQLKQPDGDALQAALCPTTTGTPPRCTGGTPIIGTLVDLPGEWGGLRVLDITNPAKPHQVSVYRTPNAQQMPPPDYRGIYSVHHAVVQGETAYVAWNSDGLRVLDLRSGQPRETFSFVPQDANDPTGTLPAKAYVQGVAVSPNFVLATDVNSGLYVFCFAGQPCPPATSPGGTTRANQVAPAATASPVSAATGRQTGGRTQGRLPVTGATLWKLILMALALIAVGVAVRILTRRREAAARPPGSPGSG
jgi:hypothetical protein